ncbi:hypothetical protein [Vibrio vulnificus]|uniref:hypothetical protein n=1 Tax=Vibrio vulnificus TaxID=672 RepID=UPI00287A71A2|nr:hypothetical protein [Vibrio vulnificus]MDS1842165.1 hypothetical protein [Vibrio vulnificus]MDS1850778.1 hypothetical protein [Vibrio vulnificus]
MKPADLERLIHESLEELGWSANASELANRVLRLNVGLPLEDEFSVLCGWLGKCTLIHKLDQQQYPSQSKSDYQVPDLMAVFDVNGRPTSVLIEVKSSHKNVLSFTPDYIQKLKNYSSLMSLPVLVAWKNKFGIWSLVPLEAFKKATKNFNLNFNDALCNSLMGVLAGDFGYSLGVGAGVHIQAKKQKLHNVEVIEEGKEYTESWQSVIDDVYFTSYKGEIFRNLSPIAQQVFFSWDLTEESTVTDTHLTMHSYCAESSLLFAQMALTRILAFHKVDSEQHLRWRAILGGDKSISAFENFREGIIENLDKGIVHHVIDIMPQNSPKFLERI